MKEEQISAYSKEIAVFKQKDLFNSRDESTNNPINRFDGYNKEHCWQYEIRLQNLNKDLEECGITKTEVEKMVLSDFSFDYIDSAQKTDCRQIKSFIERHEWLSKMPNRPTHRFTAKYKGYTAGAVVMATPNSFSNILGSEHRDKEKLISRGACISWSPKNLGSWLVMRSIKWMVKNTDFRVFTAYSDPEAKELGTIYQACNFYYLGKRFGSKHMYLDPRNPDKGWFSDREFRKQSKYRIYAANIGIAGNEFDKYIGKWTPKWDQMPSDTRKAIKNEEKKYRESCKRRKVVSKHKYAYILGANKKETKHLKKLFTENNPGLDLYSYPKARGV